MKPGIRLFLLSLGLLLFAQACSEEGGESDRTDSNEKNTFVAEILEAHDSYFVVAPKEGESEAGSADLIGVSVREAKLMDEVGNGLTASEFKAGMEVEIVYDGMIAESYPAQIFNCHEIRIVKQ